MGGQAECPLCKEWKELTEHHVKESGKKLMCCEDCHRLVTRYLQALERMKS